MSDLALEKAVDLLGCMAHPVRFSALRHLHEHGPTHVSALADLLRVEQSALSHHLRRLRDAGLVVGDRQGKQIVYRLHDEHIGCILADTLAHAAELVNEEEA